MLQKSLQNSGARQLRVAVALLMLLCAAAEHRAQSNDPNFPTPVFNSEVVGRITPRDVGDPRRTRHFYTFRGTEGDLVVNLETAELIGDVDVFTATTLRPLVKFTLFGDSARLTKSFYIRREETLVLRVEARAIGDTEGTYRISFGGSFAPAPAGLAATPEPPAPGLSAAEPRGTRRVTSTGARIEEPRAETPPAPEATAASPTPERTPERRGTAASRRGRNTRNPPARSRSGAAAAQPAAPGAETTEARAPEENNPAAAATPEAAATSAPRPNATARRRAPRGARRGSARERAATGGETAAPSETPVANQPEPVAAPVAPTVTARRLIIVTKDGETFEQEMSAVRRVTIENSQVVVVMRDGKVTRRPLANVLKMSIEP